MCQREPDQKYRLQVWLHINLLRSNWKTSAFASGMPGTIEVTRISESARGWRSTRSTRRTSTRCGMRSSRSSTPWLDALDHASTTSTGYSRKRDRQVSGPNIFRSLFPLEPELQQRSMRSCCILGNSPKITFKPFKGFSCCWLWRPPWTLSWVFLHDIVGWGRLGEFLLS